MHQESIDARAEDLRCRRQIECITRNAAVLNNHLTFNDQDAAATCLIGSSVRYRHAVQRQFANIRIPAIHAQNTKTQRPGCGAALKS
jgi:hypothetical protein